MYDGLKNLEVPRRARRHPRARRAAKISLIVLVVLMLGVIGTGAWVYKTVNDRFNDARDSSIEVEPVLPDQPTNVLVLGSDQRNVVDKDQRSERQFRGSGGKLSDTMLLVHISAEAEQAVVMSIPRDLRVEIPGHGTQKINAAYSIGGPNLAIKTVRRLTGIPINAYVEVNFAGFQGIIDAVGGVEVCVKQAYDDPKSGLKIPKAGCYDMDGDQALSWVRARNIDPRADLGRVERQQQFLRLLMRKVKSLGFLLRWDKVLALAGALEDGVVLDGDIDLNLARSAASKLSGSQKKVDFRIVPNDSTYIGGVSYLIAREDEAAALFRAIRRDEPLPPYGKTAASLPSPEDITVKILNGTEVAGLAGEERDRLRTLGYRVVSVGNAKRTFEQTVIRVRAGNELTARLLEEEYPDARVEVTLKEQAVDVLITLGADYAEQVAAESTA